MPFIGGILTLLSSFYTTPGFCNEVLHLYLATDFKRTGNNLDDDEFLEIIEPELAVAITWIKDGKIKDSKTIIGILMAKDFLNERLQGQDQK